MSSFKGKEHASETNVFAAAVLEPKRLRPNLLSLITMKMNRRQRPRLFSTRYIYHQDNSVSLKHSLLFREHVATRT